MYIAYYFPFRIWCYILEDIIRRNICIEVMIKLASNYALSQSRLMHEFEQIDNV